MVYTSDGVQHPSPTPTHSPHTRSKSDLAIQNRGNVKLPNQLLIRCSTVEMMTYELLHKKRRIEELRGYNADMARHTGCYATDFRHANRNPHLTTALQSSTSKLLHFVLKVPEVMHAIMLFTDIRIRYVVANPDPCPYSIPSPNIHQLQQWAYIKYSKPNASTCVMTHNVLDPRIVNI